MLEVEQLAEQIRACLPAVKSGSLRFWGEWFGKPYDNIHRVVGCEAEHDVLRLQFDEDETLSVWAPRGITVSDQTLKITDATRVRWEWFYYGRPKTQANRYFLDFEKTADRIASSTNVDWYAPDLKPTLEQPAVEIL